MQTDRKLVLITRKTRLQELQEKYCTLGQAKFYLEHLGESFEAYEDEHLRFDMVKNNIMQALRNIGRVQLLDRELLPSYLFSPDDIVIVLGQDGLVANTLKYLDGQPVIAINPLPDLFDGVLLPFQCSDIHNVIHATLNNRIKTASITFAEVTTNLGDKLLAVNDLFVGPKTHISARYQLNHSNKTEDQCSSGIIISTGLGSTGWMKSILCGASAICGTSIPKKLKNGIAWNSNQLLYAVREPFPSAVTQCSHVFGTVTNQNKLTLSSRMPENGVIFSDGIEQDAISFNAGTVATIGVSQRQGCLVTG